MKTLNLKNLSSIYLKYDVFLFDIFGVLHDGEDLIPETVDVIEQLSKNNKEVFFLTNAPHRSTFIMEQLKQLGIPDSFYRGIFTAGDQTHHCLETHAIKSHAYLGKTCYFIGSKSMEDILPSPEYERSWDIESADFLLVAGPESATGTLDNYKSLLQNASKRGIPMVCSNPDLFVYKKDNLEIRAGQLAAFYENLGSKVFYHGKPHQETYDLVFKKLRGIIKSRILVVGDSMLTDVTGANGAHIDSLLTVSLATLKEINLTYEQLTFANFVASIKRLDNASYEPTYFAYPLAW